MSAFEIVHRLREQLRRETDRLRFYAQVHSEEIDLLDDLSRRNGSSLKEYFRNGPSQRFYPSIRNRRSIAESFGKRHPEWLDRTISNADAICEHRVNLLAYGDVSVGTNINWHRDPVSGYEWPRRYWADYDLVHFPPADAKIIHELNRHQHLPRLAKAFFLTGDESYAREAVSQIESWIAQNPRRNGVNWHSSLEIGIRCISWLWTLLLLLESESLSEGQLQAICRSLLAQLDHVYRYPSTYSSPNTHLIGEATALIIAAVVFQEIPRARAWRAFGANTLIREMHCQVFNDGMHGELSSYYHCYAADFYLQALTLAHINGISVPHSVWNRFSRMFDVLMHMTRPDGTIPLVGDDDGGRALALASQNYLSYSDGLCSASVLLRRPDLKYQAGRFCEETLWLLGDEAEAVFAEMTPQHPAGFGRAFEDAGYIVQRSGWSADDTHVMFDCGNMGIDSGGHAHADALSLTLFTAGRECLIDPGTGVYNCAPEWRDFFRSTAAHNTVLVDGGGQSQPKATFQWKTKSAGQLRRHIALPDIDYVEGEVEFRGIRHNRRLVYIRPGYWIVLDQLRGAGIHDFDFLYHFPRNAGLTVALDEKEGEVDCRLRIEDAGLQMYMYASEPVQTRVICGQSQSLQGWASRLYGDRHESPLLKASLRDVGNVSMLSFLVPGGEPRASCRLKTNTTHAIAASIRDGVYDDCVLMTDASRHLQFNDDVMRGEFFWLRSEQGKLRRLLAVNAWMFSCAGQMLFESDEPIPYVQACFWENGIVIERGEQEGKIYVRDLRDRQFQH